MKMHRIGIGAMCLMIVLVFGATWEVSGQNQVEEMCIPMGVIPLKPPEGVAAKKATVEFPHARHFITDCKECHHTWTGDVKIQNCTASGCHDLIVAPEKSKKYLSYTDVSIKYYKYAYHQMCIGCHKEIKMRNKAIEQSYKVDPEKIKAAGPSGCIECHPK
jgi:hypothetical protein